jgi:hypothetical protein
VVGQNSRFSAHWRLGRVSMLREESRKGSGARRDDAVRAGADL